MLTDRMRDHEDPRVNILFVCSRNQWRSPTAERVWRDTPGLAVRSAGTRRSARHTVTEGDVVWADSDGSYAARTFGGVGLDQDALFVVGSEAAPLGLGYHFGIGARRRHGAAQ